MWPPAEPGHPHGAASQGPHSAASQGISILLTEFISQIFQKTNNFDENHKIINKKVKVVNLEILKVKTWFGDKDLFS